MVTMAQSVRREHTHTCMHTHTHTDSDTHTHTHCCYWRINMLMVLIVYLLWIDWGVQFCVLYEIVYFVFAIGNFSHGKLGSLLPKKFSCNRDEDPSLAMVEFLRNFARMCCHGIFNMHRPVVHWTLVFELIDFSYQVFHEITGILSFEDLVTGNLSHFMK